LIFNSNARLTILKDAQKSESFKGMLPPLADTLDELLLWEPALFNLDGRSDTSYVNIHLSPATVDGLERGHMDYLKRRKYTVADYFSLLFRQHSSPRKYKLVETVKVLRCLMDGKVVEKPKTLSPMTLIRIIMMHVFASKYTNRELKNMDCPSNEEQFGRILTQYFAPTSTAFFNVAA
jgi:hypothetical protein